MRSIHQINILHSSLPKLIFQRTNGIFASLTVMSLNLISISIHKFSPFRFHEVSNPSSAMVASVFVIASTNGKEMTTCVIPLVNFSTSIMRKHATALFFLRFPLLTLVLLVNGSTDMLDLAVRKPRIQDFFFFNRLICGGITVSMNVVQRELVCAGTPAGASVITVERILLNILPDQLRISLRSVAVTFSV